MGRGNAPILPPYTDNHSGPRARWTGYLILAAVIVFCLFYGFAFALFAQVLMILLLAPLPMLALLVIWALPNSRTPPTGAMTFFLFASMAGLIAWPNYLAFAPPGMPWITMQRLTGFPLVTLLLVCLSVSGTFRETLRQTFRTTPLIWWQVGAFTVIAGLSIVFSHDKLLSVDRFLVAQISWTAPFVAAAYIFQKPGRVEAMGRLLWATAVFVGVLGVLEKHLGHVPWLGHIPSFLKIENPVVANTLAERSRDGQLRVKGTFSTPLGFGEFLALATPFIIQFAAVRSYSWHWRVLAGISCLFVLYVAYLTTSRLGMIGCMLSYIVYFFVWAGLKWRRDRQSLLAPALLLSAPVSLATLLLATAVFGTLRHIVWGKGSTGGSDDDRKQQLIMGIPKILTHPWGHGIGMGGDALGFAPFGFLTIDNYYLSAFLEFGVVGAGVYFGSFVAGIFYSARTMTKPIGSDRDFEFIKPAMIAMVNFLLVKSVFSEIDNHPLVFMFLGMTVALVYRFSRREELSAAAKAGPKLVRIRRRHGVREAYSTSGSLEPRT